MYVCIYVIWFLGGVLNAGLPEFQTIIKLIQLDKGRQLTAQPLYSVLIIIIIVINFVLFLLLDILCNDNLYVLYG
jgi:hypothetical protein